MQFLLTGDPEAVRRVEKGTRILMEEIEGADNEEPLCVTVYFHDDEELHVKKKKGRSQYRMQRACTLFPCPELGASSYER